MVCATATCTRRRSARRPAPAFITGRNHHSNHLACLTNGSTGYPGSDGYIPFENGFLSEILLQKGYNTYCVGKWHLAPEETMTAAGPYDRWPLGRGFERYYGFLGGDTHQYYPELVRDNSQTEPEKTPEEGYHLTPDLVEKAKAMIADAKQVAPNKPFFMYFALGAMHSPHHVPKEWADKYKGKFDAGWDAYRKQVFEKQKELGIIPANTVLSRHDPDVQDWDALSADERRVYARMMEVFAGLPDPHRPLRRRAHPVPQGPRRVREHTHHADLGQRLQRGGRPARIGERVQVLQQRPGHGRTEPGGHRRHRRAEGFQSLPVGLDVCRQHAVPSLEARDLPGWHQRPVHRHVGPRVSRRAARSARSTHTSSIWCRQSSMRSALSRRHPIRGVTQSPIEGVSLVHTFDDAKAPSKHTTQYFEMMGHRSLYHDGWRAVCPWPGTSFTESGRTFGTPITYDMLTELDAKGWELYNLNEDFAETNNLADKEKARLIAMIGMWYNEAGKYNVLPIDSRGLQRIREERPQIAVNRNRYVLYPGTQSIPAGAAPKILNRPYSITAEVDIPKKGAEGVLLSMGGNDGGISFYVQDGKLCFVHNYVAVELYYVKSKDHGTGRPSLPEHGVRADRQARLQRRARARRASSSFSSTARRSVVASFR